MRDQSGARPLVAIRLPRAEAAVAVGEAWDRDEAVAVLDPAAPRGVLSEALAILRPTHLLDDAGRRPFPNGVAVEADVLAVVVTSGTTGTPKAVELTAAGQVANAAGFGAALGARPEHRWLLCGPLHHISGLALVARARTWGASVVVHQSFDPAAVARAARDEGVTHVSVVPTMLGRLLEAGAPLQELERVVVGGAPFPPGMRERAEATGAPLCDSYGMTETWGGVTVDGVPFADAEVVISESGEVLVRSPQVMRGYRFRPDATRAVIDAEGFLHTGDVGVLEGGRLRIVDRHRDLVITGGVNVSPTAVEMVLSEHPDIAEVCVVGTPDPEWGERVVAFVVARDRRTPPTVESIRAFGRTRLSAAQLPRQVVVTDAIPRSPGGKVLRRELRDSLGAPAPAPIGDPP